MLNRKNTPLKSAARSGKSAKPKTAPVRRRFVISNPRRDTAKNAETNGKSKSHTATTIATAAQKLPTNGNTLAPAAAPGQSNVDLTETIKTLLHLSQEHGYVTYDDINDVLPDNLSPEDLDVLLTKLRGLDVEIVMDQAEAERSERKQPEQPQQEEVEEDSRLEILDDPVRMYMNQMGKVPLLTREQEVEICKKIEEAEVAMKAIVYGLGFTAKEHIAIAEKHLSEPPKERFDRVIVDKKSPTAKAICAICASSSKKSAPSTRKWTKNILPGRKPSKKAARKNWRAN